MLTAQRQLVCSRCRSIPLTRRNASSSAPKSTKKAGSAVSEGISDEWETIIGLEIHAQIRTGRKLFSRAPTSYNDPPNTHVEPHDTATPGSLPVLDKRAIRLGVMTALALGCDINPRSTFDRKHYFYHDIPASYQITQHYNPLARDGQLAITIPTPITSPNSTVSGKASTKSASPSSDGVTSRVVRIKQVQIEQDTAKSQTISSLPSPSSSSNGESHTLIDLNRAGTGLMEIVTEPDMRSAAEAGSFVRRLQSLLRRIGSGDGDMEKGNLRIDANVSVRRRGAGEAFGTRCEIKNLNSVRFLQVGIAAEAARHVRHNEENPGVALKQETRGLDEMTGQTFSLRSKEEATDYRYMPDGNLPSITISPMTVEKMKGKVPEMPWDTIKRLVEQYGLNEKDAETIMSLDEYDGTGVRYFETAAEGLGKELARKVGNWLVHETLGQLKKENRSWNEGIVPVGLLREMVDAIEAGTINGSSGKAIIRHFVHLPTTNSADINAESHLDEIAVPNLESVLASLGIQKLDPSASTGDVLAEWCSAAMAKLPKEAKMVGDGNDKVVMRIVGEVMKLSSGAADARKAREVIIATLRA